MPIYYHRACDRSGRTLHQEALECGSLHEAMIEANTRIRCMSLGVAQSDVHPVWRVEIADDDGHPVARIYCMEVIAASAVRAAH
jgi:hypothetical protein